MTVIGGDATDVVNTANDDGGGKQCNFTVTALGGDATLRNVRLHVHQR